ncbi:acyl carrier protein [Sulfitobacter sp.]|nr:acyl carrier protein [Sulfitobacter sp.]
MDDAKILSDLETIIRELFDDYDGPVSADLNASEVEQWDSLGNVQFMVMIEKMMSVRFEMGEIQSLQNLGALVELIKKKSK